MAEKDQYDFFMNTGNKAASKKSFLPTPGSKKFMLIIMGVAILVLSGAYMLLNKLQTNSDAATRQRLTSLAQQQNELIRVADIGVKKARNLEAKNLAGITQLSLMSERTALQTAIKAEKVKVSNSTLNADIKKRHDQELTTADQSNRFDEKFLEIVKEDLITYQKSLKIAYDSSQNQKFKVALAEQYKKAATLAGVNPEL